MPVEPPSREDRFDAWIQRGIDSTRPEAWLAAVLFVVIVASALLSN